jgi:hypothetical protein
MKRGVQIACALGILIALAGCAAGPNDLVDSPDEEGEIAGFLPGLWHGLISPFTFIISLFSDNVTMYDVHNNGGWYNLGFLFGVMITFGGSGGGASRSRRRG